MSDEPVPMTAEIGVGAMVRLRTERDRPLPYVVVKVGRWWPNRGKLRILHRKDYDNMVQPAKWVYPCEVELAEVNR